MCIYLGFSWCIETTSAGGLPQDKLVPFASDKLRIYQSYTCSKCDSTRSDKFKPIALAKIAFISWGSETETHPVSCFTS